MPLFYSYNSISSLKRPSMDSFLMMIPPIEQHNQPFLPLNSHAFYLHYDYDKDKYANSYIDSLNIQFGTGVNMFP